MTTLWVPRPGARFAVPTRMLAICGCARDANCRADSRSDSLVAGFTRPVWSPDELDDDADDEESDLPGTLGWAP
jgi:hypothetical protein